MSQRPAIQIPVQQTKKTGDGSALNKGPSNLPEILFNVQSKSVPVEENPRITITPPPLWESYPPDQPCSPVGSPLPTAAQPECSNQTPSHDAESPSGFSGMFIIILTLLTYDLFLICFEWMWKYLFQELTNSASETRSFLESILSLRARLFFKSSCFPNFFIIFKVFVDFYFWYQGVPESHAKVKIF